MNLIVDASIAVKWFIPEPQWEYAVRLQSRSDLFAPDFMQLECSNVLTKKVRRGEIDREAADQIQQQLQWTPIQLYPWQELLGAATMVAHDTRRSLYDCLYVALAHQLDGQMVTADRKLYHSLKADPPWGRHLLWIETLDGLRGQFTKSTK